MKGGKKGPRWAQLPVEEHDHLNRLSMQLDILLTRVNRKLILDIPRDKFTSYMSEENVDFESAKGKGTRNNLRNKTARKAIVKIIKDFAQGDTWKAILESKVTDDKEKREWKTVFKKDIRKILDEQSILIQNVISGVNMSKGGKKVNREKEMEKETD